MHDAIVYKDAKDQCYWIYNRYSHCEWLKHYMVHYAVVSREEAIEKLAQNSLFAAPPKDLENLFFITHELTYHYAMEIAKGRMYWQDAIPCDTNDFQEEHDAWYEQTKEKYRLNEEYETIKFKD